MTTKIGTLKAMRLEKRLTQAEVAAKMKVSQSYYSGIEQGNKPGEVAEAMQLVNRMCWRRCNSDHPRRSNFDQGRKAGLRPASCG